MSDSSYAYTYADGRHGFRPSSDDYFMAMAHLVSTRSTCRRRSVGCVLVNARKHVIATGYNGVAPGEPHCNEPVRQVLVRGGSNLVYPNQCFGATAASGTELDSCEASHAEQSALLQCRDVYDIDTCYVTTMPCTTCVKLLLNTACQRIVFTEDYALGNARRLWLKAGRKLIQATDAGGKVIGFTYTERYD